LFLPIFNIDKIFLYNFQFFSNININAEVY
jgi:hypothetical protein